MPFYDGDLFHLIQDSSIEFSDNLRLAILKDIASSLSGFSFFIFSYWSAFIQMP